MADGYIADNGGDEIGNEFHFDRKSDDGVTLSLSGGADTVKKLTAR